MIVGYFCLQPMDLKDPSTRRTKERCGVDLLKPLFKKKFTSPSLPARTCLMCTRVRDTLIRHSTCATAILSPNCSFPLLICMLSSWMSSYYTL